MLENPQKFVVTRQLPTIAWLVKLAESEMFFVWVH